MKTTNLIAAVIISAGLAVGATAQAGKQEVTVQLVTLPRVVQKTIHSKAGSDKVVRVNRQTENGKDTYEAIINKDGKQTAIMVDSNGAYLGSHDESSEKGEKADKSKKH